MNVKTVVRGPSSLSTLFPSAGHRPSFLTERVQARQSLPLATSAAQSSTRGHSSSPGSSKLGPALGVGIPAAIILIILVLNWARGAPNVSGQRRHPARENTSWPQNPVRRRSPSPPPYPPPRWSPPHSWYPSHPPAPPRRPSQPPPRRSHQTRNPSHQKKATRASKDPRATGHEPNFSTSTAASSHQSPGFPPVDIEMHDLEAGLNPWEGELSRNPSVQCHQPRWVNHSSSSSSSSPPSDGPRDGNDTRVRRGRGKHVAWVDELQRRERDQTAMPGGYPSSTGRQSSRDSRRGNRQPLMSGALRSLSPPLPQPQPGRQGNVWTRQYVLAERSVRSPERPAFTYQTRGRRRERERDNADSPPRRRVRWVSAPDHGPGEVRRVMPQARMGG